MKYIYILLQNTSESNSPKHVSLDWKGWSTLHTFYKLRYALFQLVNNFSLVFTWSENKMISKRIILKQVNLLFLFYICPKLLAYLVHSFNS